MIGHYQIVQCPNCGEPREVASNGTLVDCEHCGPQAVPHQPSPTESLFRRFKTTLKCLVASWLQTGCPLW